MYIAIIVLSALLWFIVSYYKWMRDVYFPVEQLRGSIRLPIIGTYYIHIGLSREELSQNFIRYLNKYGPLARTWNGSRPEVHITTPDLVEEVINKHLAKGEQYSMLHPWLGEGLLTSHGSKWHQRRKLISPTFHFQILENFMTTFVEKTQILLKILDHKADGEIHNIYPDITHCALDIICQTAMGVNVNAMSDENNEYVKAVYNFGKIVIWKALRPYIPHFIFKLMPQGRRFMKDIQILHGLSNRIIAERKKLLKTNLDCRSKDDDSGCKTHLSFLDMLLEASEDGQILNDTDIREEVDTFMFEGHDTTAVAMSWALFLLGNHLDIQERVHEEVCEVLRDKPIPTTLSELHDLKFLDCVIKEALRLYPSVPFIIRDTLEELEIGQHKLPRSTQIVFHMYMIHMNPDHYPEPHKFDPDRFLPENCLGRHPYAYLPFSAGARNCIGALIKGSEKEIDVNVRTVLGQKFAMFEEKTILASIIKRYRVIAMEDVSNVKWISELTLKPIHGIFVRLVKRR